MQKRYIRQLRSTAAVSLLPFNRRVNDLPDQSLTFALLVCCSCNQPDRSPPARSAWLRSSLHFLSSAKRCLALKQLLGISQPFLCGLCQITDIIFLSFFFILLTEIFGMCRASSTRCSIIMYIANHRFD